MPEKKKSSLYLASLRLDRWPRSTAIIVGSAAVFLVHPDWLRSALTPVLPLKIILAFILTWMVSTANYIVNEITDAPFDAHHPRKKTPPAGRQGDQRSGAARRLGAAGGRGPGDRLLSPSAGRSF